MWGLQGVVDMWFLVVQRLVSWTELNIRSQRGAFFYSCGFIMNEEKHESRNE